jgi:hypothetical protein
VRSKEEKGEDSGPPPPVPIEGTTPKTGTEEEVENPEEDEPEESKTGAEGGALPNETHGGEASPTGRPTKTRDALLSETESKTGS